MKNNTLEFHTVVKLNEIEIYIKKKSLLTFIFNFLEFPFGYKKIHTLELFEQRYDSITYKRLTNFIKSYLDDLEVKKGKRYNYILSQMDSMGKIDVYFSFSQGDN